MTDLKGKIQLRSFQIFIKGLSTNCINIDNSKLA
jgi:hypothetical protein